MVTPRINQLSQRELLFRQQRGQISSAEAAGELRRRQSGERERQQRLEREREKRQEIADVQRQRQEILGSERSRRVAEEILAARRRPSSADIARERLQEARDVQDQRARVFGTPEARRRAQRLFDERERAIRIPPERTLERRLESKTSRVGEKAAAVRVIQRQTGAEPGEKVTLKSAIGAGVAPRIIQKAGLATKKETNTILKALETRKELAEKVGLDAPPAKRIEPIPEIPPLEKPVAKDIRPFTGPEGTDLVAARRGGISEAELEREGFSKPDIEAASKEASALGRLDQGKYLAKDGRINAVQFLVDGGSSKVLEDAGLDPKLIRQELQPAAKLFKDLKPFTKPDGTINANEAAKKLDFRQLALTEAGRALLPDLMQARKQNDALDALKPFADKEGNVNTSAALRVLGEKQTPAKAKAILRDAGFSQADIKDANARVIAFSRLKPFTTKGGGVDLVAAVSSQEKLGGGFISTGRKLGINDKLLRDAGFDQGQIDEARVIARNLNPSPNTREWYTKVGKDVGLQVADTVVPGVWARNWNQLSNRERAVNIAFDALFLVPLVGQVAKVGKGARAASRLGKGAQGTRKTLSSVRASVGRKPSPEIKAETQAVRSSRDNQLVQSALETKRIVGLSSSRDAKIAERAVLEIGEGMRKGNPKKVAQAAKQLDAIGKRINNEALRNRVRPLLTEKGAANQIDFFQKLSQVSKPLKPPRDITSRIRNAKERTGDAIKTFLRDERGEIEVGPRLGKRKPGERKKILSDQEKKELAERRRREEQQRQELAERRRREGQQGERQREPEREKRRVQVATMPPEEAARLQAREKATRELLESIAEGQKRERQQATKELLDQLSEGQKKEQRQRATKELLDQISGLSKREETSLQRTLNQASRETTQRKRALEKAKRQAEKAKKEAEREEAAIKFKKIAERKAEPRFKTKLELEAEKERIRIAQEQRRLAKQGEIQRRIDIKAAQQRATQALEKALAKPGVKIISRTKRATRVRTRPAVRVTTRTRPARDIALLPKLQPEIKVKPLSLTRLAPAQQVSEKIKPVPKPARAEKPKPMEKVQPKPKPSPVDKVQPKPKPAEKIQPRPKPSDKIKPKPKPKPAERLKPRSRRPPGKPQGRFPKFDLPGDAEKKLKRGEFPRVVSHRQGLFNITTDLDTGKQTFDRAKGSGKGVTPSESFKVVTKDKSKPPQRKFPLGVVNLQVGPSSVSFQRRLKGKEKKL